MNVALVS